MTTTEEKLIAVLDEYAGNVPQGAEMILAELSDPPHNRDRFWWTQYLDPTVELLWNSLSVESKLVAMLWAGQRAEATLLAAED